MTGPPETGQKEAPKGVDALRGAKGQTNDFRAKDGSLSQLVKGGEKGAAAHGGLPAERGPAVAAVLPCLNSNICTKAPNSRAVLEGFRRLSTNHKKCAYKLTLGVKILCNRYGVGRVGFLTPSFPDHVTSAKEASRRFHSLATHVLSDRYEDYICVLERMKSGRIHFHLLVVLDEDIRTGFNFEQAAHRNYSSANPYLRAEWAFWRSITDYDGKHPHHVFATFGRTELMPVKSNDEGISKYVGKYIAKHVGSREERDKGVRLVRYSRGASNGSQAFSFISPRSKLWRWQLGEFARRAGIAPDDFAAFSLKFGKRWANPGGQTHRQILEIEPSGPLEWRDGKGGEPVSLWELWSADRRSLALVAAEDLGCSLNEAFAALFQPQFKKELFFTVPAFSGDVFNRPVHEDEWEQTVVWN